MANNSHVNWPWQLQPPNSPLPPGLSDTVLTDLISSKIDKLIGHPDFVLFSPIIRTILEASDNEWRTLRDIRQELSRSALFRTHFANVFDTPPQEIFDFIVQIRTDKSWNTRRQDVLMQVSTRRLSGSSWTSSQASGHAPIIPTTFTRPREGPFYSPSRVRQSHSGFVSQHPARGARSRCAGGSPTSTEDHSSAVSDGRTAPAGYRFYCLSQNCTKSYSRQGHYENHMHRCHAEIALHNPIMALDKISSRGQPSAVELGGHVRPIKAKGGAPPTTPQPALSTSMPYTSIPPSPIPEIVPPPAPTSHAVHSLTIESGTGPQIKHSQKRPLGTDMSPSVFQYDVDTASHSPSWYFFDGVQPFLGILPSQTISNSGRSLFSTGSHVGS
ncbi:uncharacterized protein Z519_08020 [Cladophialophora bantiana CBS 173.52]|uniref:C2H2-type domain-containing protein n=1 Tax=Cladophialophora bantiana (strain ATCC 10958 / CBS 173.52 / CDC B-1940 / NIH 8579) TaxID=1442370 RepID=A0A0D2EM89_CLAB1|nr:uncharacterized protein Z519_08020 [Cladophialophora bantiana CBS 173.52]KIW91126.1 hypothetical protein Z519_08020 [Cladophialophora bantiana CBS 173.52]